MCAHLTGLLTFKIDKTFLVQWCVRCIRIEANPYNLSSLTRYETLIASVRSFKSWLFVLVLFSFPVYLCC